MSALVGGLESVQVFGRKDSRPTQAAIRFFRDRRIAISMVDVGSRPPAPTELRRFAQRLGPRALIDPESRAYRDQGLAYLSMDDAEVQERLKAKDIPLTDEGETICCDARSEKSWIQDPSGIAWEAYRTMEDVQLFSGRDGSDEGACCTPDTMGTPDCCEPSKKTAGCCD